MAQQYRAQRTRQELIRAAAEVFENAGFAEASISAISSRAGVSNGALHFHFSNKRALGEAVERAAAQTLLHITGHVPLRHPTPLQLLVDTSQALARQLLDDPVLRAGFCLGSDGAWECGLNLWEQWHDWVQLMLTVARDRGSLAADVEIEDAVSTITAVVTGLQVLARTDPKWCSAGTVTGFWRLLLPQLSGDTAEQPSPDSTAAAGSWPADSPRGSWQMDETCGAT
ncbi:ScbR family autoregulator-binding transcription factor [Streptomyces sp. TRM70350]|uniref:ScbR family autoregulator-binding transcription factor n=1 Tax=Streptomyces sp. TRM70350 TaxID=2856165 RepID=UPI001C46CC6A|nr:ScbR family autoregulator-binding transcription factor [Streptomyces sp. TRM70350]MBV7699712.1 TetR/AcrR family transcriptional regulator [Streptomyces sp. TRM70350]